MSLILGIDPGSKNMSLSILEHGNILATHMLKETIYALRQEDMDKVIDAYEDKMREIINKYGIRQVIIERWVVRGFASNSMELVAIMVGVLRTVCRSLNIPIRLLTAAQWKKPVGVHLNLKALYKQYWKKPYRIQPHTIDSLLIARYLFNKECFTSKDEEWINDILSNSVYKPLPGLYHKPRFQFRLNRRVVF